MDANPSNTSSFVNRCNILIIAGIAAIIGNALLSLNRAFQRNDKLPSRKFTMTERLTYDAKALSNLYYYNPFTRESTLINNTHLFLMDGKIVPQLEERMS
jgi:hypothetical protein